MNETLKAMLDRGSRLLTDTKKTAIPPGKKSKVSMSELGGQVENDPHKNFVKRTITEKPKKAEVVKDIKKFIERAEADL